MFDFFFIIFLLLPFVQNFQCPNENLIRENLQNVHIPGAAILVLNQNSILYEQSFGHHSFSPSEFININKSIFTLASLSKTFISIAVMQLVELKQLNLDENISLYLNETISHPFYPSIPITLRQLLSHSASINANNDLFIRSNDFAFAEFNLQDFCLHYLKSNQSNWLNYPPGNVTLYSNEGTALAALIVQRISNMSYEKYVQEKILRPLNINLKTSSFRLNQIENQTELVQQYAYVSNSFEYQQWKEGIPQLNITKLMIDYPSLLHIPFFSFATYPAGLLRMTAIDLAKFLQMFMNNGSPLLHLNSINEIKKVVGNGQILPYNSDDNNSSVPSIQFGLIWNWRIMNDGRKFVGHRGTNLGATHLMMINEQNTIGVIILTNGDMSLPNDLSRKIYDTLTDIQIMLFDCFENKINHSCKIQQTISSFFIFYFILFMIKY